MSMGLAATRRLAALASLLAVTGCWVPLEKGRMLEARVQRLEVETKEQAQVLDVQVRERIALVDKKLREVQVKLDELNTVSRAKGADLGVAVARLGEELTKVKGDLEAQAHNLAQLQHQVAEAGKETETRLASLKGTGALDEAMARQKIAELPKPDDRAAVFGLAQQLETGGDRGVAREVFLHYVKRWPRDEKAPEAAFKAGHLLAQQSKWREAVVVFGKVAEDYPKSERAPEALLQVAEGLVQLDRKDDAKGVLEQLVAEHPRSDAARKAKARLAELFPAKDVKKAAPKKK
jgi:tol-pal system protein YbgF